MMKSNRTETHRYEGAPNVRRGFTLIELIVAVGVLIIVIFATAHLFGTASRVTGTGHAAASVMQEAAVIERMMRADIKRLSPDGFFAIRQVAVPNDINGGDRLLNPMRPHNAWIRADQLVFFADGVAGMQTFGIGGDEFGQGAMGTAIQSQGIVSRVYYGHAFQLPRAQPVHVVAANDVLAHDPQVDVVPWHSSIVAGDVPMGQTRFATVAAAGGSEGFGVYERSSPSGGFAHYVDGTQPEARQWLLARQAVALVDDDGGLPRANSKTVYLNNRTARSIFREGTPFAEHDVFGWSHEIRNGRMDGAASGLDEIWEYIRSYTAADNWHWREHRNVISEQLLYYPRAERFAPGPHRVDQALTNHVIGSAVSSFIIEWTYSDGTGDRFDEDGKMLCEFTSGPFDGEILPCDLDVVGDRERFGFYTNYFPPGPSHAYQPEHPWFGLNLPDRGVGRYGFVPYQNHANFKRAYTISDHRNIERGLPATQFQPPLSSYPGAEDIQVYEAIFGYNRNRPSAPNPFNDFIDESFNALAYTPWPSAIRVTMVLHDPQGRLEHGREYQFVIDLPKRVRK